MVQRVLMLLFDGVVCADGVVRAVDVSGVVGVNGVVYVDGAVRAYDAVWVDGVGLLMEMFVLAIQFV